VLYRRSVRIISCGWSSEAITMSKLACATEPVRFLRLAANFFCTLPLSQPRSHLKPIVAPTSVLSNTGQTQATLCSRGRMSAMCGLVSSFSSSSADSSASASPSTSPPSPRAEALGDACAHFASRPQVHRRTLRPFESACATRALLAHAWLLDPAGQGPAVAAPARTASHSRLAAGAPSVSRPGV